MKYRRSLFLLLPAVLFFQAAFLAPQASDVTPFERQSNERQPPDKVMDAIGVKPGMVLGEVGAGEGRYTVHLARRVGETGKVYANDINSRSLAHLRERCQRGGLKNVEIILGKVDDPLFPKGALDLAFMILTYHHLAKPVDLLRNLISSLKPGATVAIVDPDPIKDRGRDPDEATSVEKMQKEAGEAGFELVRIETFLEKDTIFVLRVKAAILPFSPKSAERTALIDEYIKNAPALADGFTSFTYRNRNGETMPYRLFTPAGPDAGRKYPLVVFLHGAGGSGTDNVKQLQDANMFGGLVWTLPENQRLHPCFVLAPQTNVNWPCVVNEEGKRPHLGPGHRLGDGARLAFEIIDKLAAELPMDTSRVYITGHSMGGAGVWHMIARRPGFFAAAVPVCGLPDFSDAPLMKGVPIWNFNGEMDPIEPAERQRRWIGEIVKAGGDPIYTEYPGVEHDSFMWAYTEPALINWLFAQHRVKDAHPTAAPMTAKEWEAARDYLSAIEYAVR
jgi:predicted peptidase